MFDNLGFFTFAQNSQNSQNSLEGDYLKMAYGLALSLKISQPRYNKLTVGITPGQIVPQKYLQVFDHVIEIPWNDEAAQSTWKLENEWKAIHMSPYENTIKVDADMLFMSDVTAQLETMADNDLYFCTTIRDYKSAIANPLPVRALFLQNKLPMIFSAYMHFNKSKIAFEFFELSEMIFKYFKEFSFNLLKDPKPTKPTTDLVFSMAAKLLNLEEHFHHNPYISFVHMKSSLQNWPDNLKQSRWQDIVDSFINTKGELKVGLHKQTYAFHYHEKDFLTDKKISTMEKILGI